MMKWLIEHVYPLCVSLMLGASVMMALLIVSELKSTPCDNIGYMVYKNGVSVCHIKGNEQ